MIISSSEVDDENVAQDSVGRFSRQANPTRENLDIVEYALIMNIDYLCNGNRQELQSVVCINLMLIHHRRFADEMKLLAPAKNALAFQPRNKRVRFVIALPCWFRS